MTRKPQIGNLTNMNELYPFLESKKWHLLHEHVFLKGDFVVTYGENHQWTFMNLIFRFIVSLGPCYNVVYVLVSPNRNNSLTWYPSLLLAFYLLEGMPHQHLHPVPLAVPQVALPLHHPLVLEMELQVRLDSHRWEDWTVDCLGSEVVYPCMSLLGFCWQIINLIILKEYHAKQIGCSKNSNRIRVILKNKTRRIVGYSSSA